MTNRGVVDAVLPARSFVRVTGGNLSISGTVTAKDGNPRGVIAELFSAYDGLIASTECSATGAYSFSGLREGRYEVRFRHPSRKYRSRVVHVGQHEMRITRPVRVWRVGMNDTGRFGAAQGAVFTLVEGSLAPGHTLASNGVLGGVATAGGLFRAVIEVATAHSVERVQFVYRVIAYLVFTGSTGDGSATGRCFGVGNFAELRSWDSITEALARGISSSNVSVPAYLSADLVVSADLSNQFAVSNDGGGVFSHTVSADSTAASDAGRFALNHTTGTILRTRGSTTGAPPNVCARYPLGRRFAFLPSSSGIGSMFKVAVLSTGRGVGCAGDHRLVISDDDGNNWTTAGVVVTGSGSLTTAVIAVSGTTILIFCRNSTNNAGDRYIRRSTDAGATFATVHSFSNTVPFAAGDSPGGIVGGGLKWIALFGNRRTQYAYSADGGATWTEGTLPFAPVVGSEYTMAYHPYLDEFCYMAENPSSTNHSIYTSSDGGATWTLRSKPFASMQFVSMLPAYHAPPA